MLKMLGDLREKNSSIIISYFSLRQLIGLLGMLLPLICILGGYFFSKLPIQSSVSSYYHTNMRDFFVGLMVCVSFFLITYKGYEKRDQIITTIIGMAGFGIALFPCLKRSTEIQPVGIFQLNPSISDWIHILCALIFFSLLAYNSIYLFALSKDGWKNTIYRGCGYFILVSIISLVISVLTIKSEVVESYRIVLIFEIIMLLAFGFSWWVKGRALEALANASTVVIEKTQNYLSGLAKLVKRL